jgi:hypothetical protein
MLSIFALLMFHSLSPGAETFPVPYSETIDITKHDRMISLENIRVKVSMSRPALPFKTIRFTFSFTRDNKPLFPAKAEVRFNMKMDMGDYRSPLTKDGDTYTAKTLLPRCMKGGKRWFGKLSVEVNGRTLSTVFLFDLE